MRSYTAASLRAERAARSRSTARERRITPGTRARAAAEPGAAPRSGPGSTSARAQSARRSGEDTSASPSYNGAACVVRLEISDFIIYEIRLGVGLVLPLGDPPAGDVAAFASPPGGW